MENEYYYNESISRFYDPVYDKLEFLKPAQKFYHDEIMSVKGSILEAGVGTGRIFLPALKSGADIFGVDYSANMLAVLKSKIPAKEHHRVWQEDIRRFDSGRSYSLVISPFRVFQHLLTIEDQLDALNSIYNVLDDGGRLIFDVFNPDIERLTKPVENVLEFDGEYEPGKKLQRYATVNYDLSKQILNLKFSFVWDEEGSEKTDEFYSPMRYFFRYELENLIGRTKFKLEKVFGNFKREEMNNRSSDQILILKK